MKTVTTESAEETQKLADDILHNLSGNILLLYGELGSGKTTFTQGIGKALGITHRLISPTFIILRSYDIPRKDLPFKKFYHIDLYRTQTKHDLEGLGLNEVIEDQKNLVVIEWAEKLGDVLPEKRVEVRFEYVDEGKRRITIN